MRKPNRRMRRHKRDIEGGLGFSWRVPGGSLGRTAIGVLVASCLFAAAGSLVHIKMPPSAGEFRESAQVLVLDPGDPDARELLDWARLHSPFPDRWEPGSGGALEAMMAEITLGLEERARYQPRLRPLLGESDPAPLSGLIGDDDPVPLPPPVVEVALVTHLPTAEPRVEARSWAEGPLADRWGDRVLDWELDEDVPHLGREASFMVGVDRNGRVVSCLVMDGLDSELDRQIENWIRQQRIDSVPGQGEIVYDPVRFLIQPAAQKGEGEAP